MVRIIVLAIVVAACVAAAPPGSAAAGIPASFRMQMIAGESVVTVDVVRPNRYRLVEAVAGRLDRPTTELVKIDGTMYARRGSGWKRVSGTSGLPGYLALVETFLKPEALARAPGSTTTRLPAYSDFHDGAVVRRYRIVNDRIGTFTMDVKNDRPVRIDVTRNASPHAATFFYDRYGAIAPIDAPI